MATRPERLKMALRAFDDFAIQTHELRDLIIAVAGDISEVSVAITTRVRALAASGNPIKVHILALDAKTTCGGLRAAALAASTADCCCTWDDDDRNHPRRLEVQAGYMGGMAGAALSSMIVYDRPARVATWVDANTGPTNGAGGMIPATLLFRRRQGITYAPGAPTTDTALFMAIDGTGRIAAIADGPYLAVKVIHGTNARDPDQLRRWSMRHAADSALFRRHSDRIGRGLAEIDWEGRTIELVDPRAKRQATNTRR